MNQLHDRRFPGEGKQYRDARNRLPLAERELRGRVEAVAAMRRELPPGGRVETDYEFEEVDPVAGKVSAVRLSDLFENGDSLIVYGFMYGPDWDSPCPMCTSIADSIDGNAPHLSAATNLVVVAKAPPEKLLDLAAARSWHRMRFLSSYESSFNRDYHAEYDGDYGNHHPMINVFTKRDDGIFHFWASELFFVPEEGSEPRHADMIWPLWNFLDLTPEGRGDFMPKLDYDSQD